MEQGTGEGGRVMGAWGFGAFENDDAIDFMADLQDAGSWKGKEWAKVLHAGLSCCHAANAKRTSASGFRAFRGRTPVRKQWP